ncbi:MAG: hypothetical protein WBA06_14845 [Candidatus Aquilonibacter sp.]|jgi:hypothetical protein
MKPLFFALSAAVALLLTTAPSTALAENDITITNRSSRVIQFIYISPSGEKNWGEDWLAAAKYGVIVPGDHAMFRIDQGCIEDIKITFTDNSSKELYNVDTCKNNIAVTD